MPQEVGIKGKPLRRCRWADDSGRPRRRSLPVENSKRFAQDVSHALAVAERFTFLQDQAAGPEVVPERLVGVVVRMNSRPFPQPMLLSPVKTVEQDVATDVQVGCKPLEE